MTPRFYRLFLHPLKARAMIALVLFLSAFSGNVFAEFDVDDCQPSTDGVTVEIKSILSAKFSNQSDGDMQSAHTALEDLLVKVGHCSAVVRSSGVTKENRQMVIREWHSINQWLSRLTGAVGLSVLGQEGGWREEYALLAEVYEFEP